MPLHGQYAPSATDWVREQADTFEASGGTKAADFQGIPIVLLTTVGAKSGLLRKSPLIRIEHDGEYAIVASNGGASSHPSWYGNVRGNPHVTLQDGAERHDYLARAVEGDEYARWWERAVAAYDGFTGYIATANRTIPVFVLTPIKTEE
ncbi:MAG: nitroreductase family deazaflavin-dependent oxidoreductase [Pseudonocardiales bacterium]|jgi:deazaflavin-dependent oxidoreductase (nitroreductase family)|nr:nitroreductase family deazaflavin-dependent oxidoreductase [Pseudonocardiales bacterium]